MRLDEETDRSGSAYPTLTFRPESSRFAPMTPLEALVALNMLPKIGPVRVRRLLEAFGDPAAILGAAKDRLMRVDGIGEETAKILHALAGPRRSRRGDPRSRASAALPS